MILPASDQADNGNERCSGSSGWGCWRGRVLCRGRRVAHHAGHGTCRTPSTPRPTARWFGPAHVRHGFRRTRRGAGSVEAVLNACLRDHSSANARAEQRGRTEKRAPACLKVGSDSTVTSLSPMSIKLAKSSLSDRQTGQGAADPTCVCCTHVLPTEKKGWFSVWSVRRTKPESSPRLPAPTLFV